MTCILQILTENDSGKQYELVEDETYIGRDSYCDIVISDESVSRRHARLVSQEDAYVIEDLGSRNGTYVNGNRIGGKVPLKEGDRIQICATGFVLRLTERSPHPRRSSPEHDHLLSTDMISDGSTALRVGEADRLRAIIRIGKLLGATLDLRTLLARMLDGLFEIFPQAGRGLVLLCEGNRLAPAAVRDWQGKKKNVQYSKTIVRKAAVKRKAFLSPDVAVNEELLTAPSVMELEICSVMCVPLLSREMELLGVIELDSHSARAKFDAEDLEILACVANQASILVEQTKLHREMVKKAEADRDLTLAQEVQQSFLPASLSQLEGYTFWAYYQAARAVGGDFYDCIPLPNGQMGIVLGDVAGKGVPAALLMAKLSALCRQLLLGHSGNVTTLMNTLNKEVCDIVLEGKFVTLVTCVLDPKNHELRVGIAGHMPPMIRRGDLSIDDSLGYSVRGLPLGLERKQEYQTEQTRLDPGDLVVLFTDGISEAMNSKAETYSVRRVREKLTRSDRKGPAEIGQLLLEDVRRHLDGSEQDDDTCLLIFQRDPR